MDALFLRLPVVGILIRKVAVAKFSRTLGTMISSGVPILDGLDIVARTAGNKIVENAIYTDVQFSESRRTLIASKNRTLRQTFDKLRKEGDRLLFYVDGRKLFGDDGEATVDGTHPNDAGFLRMADAIEPVLRRALKRR